MGRKSQNKCKKLYEIVSGTLRVPTYPKLGRDALDPGPLRDARIETWFSKPTTVAQADANRRAAIERARERHCRNGDYSGVDDLAEAAEEFGWDPNFGELMAKLRRAERMERRSSGHPFGHSRDVKNRIRLVHSLTEGLRESGIRVAEIIRRMEEQGLGNVERQQLYRDYCAGRRLPDFQPQLFLREDRRRFAYETPGKSSNSFHVQRIRVVVPYPVACDIKAGGDWSITIKVGA